MKQKESPARMILLGVNSSDVKMETIDESGAHSWRDDQGSLFLCPKEEQVIVGRMHLGDENGKTTYKFGTLSFMNADKNLYEFKLSGVKYSEYFKESDSEFICDNGGLIVGREHIGDENGKTRYAYRELYVRKKDKKNEADWILCTRETDDCTVTVKESAGLWAEKLEPFGSAEPKATYYLPMYGRVHKGDENKDTTTYFSFMMV